MRAVSQDKCLSRAAFGRLVKLGDARVRRLIADGMPAEGTKIPVAKAQAWMAAHVDTSRRNAWQGAKEGESLNDFRRQREAQKVQQGEIEIAKARGELVERAAVSDIHHRRKRPADAGRFSRRAAAEMTRRVERIACQVMGDRASVMTDALTWAGTFHGIGARLLREYAGQIGLEPGIASMTRRLRKALSARNRGGVSAGHSPARCRMGRAILSPDRPGWPRAQFCLAAEFLEGDADISACLSETD
jgi:hypothetical protein